MNNKRMIAILLAVILAGSALAACSTAHPAAIDEETTTVGESTIPEEITVSGTQAAEDKTTLPFSDISDIKKPTTQEKTTTSPGTEQKPSDGTTTVPPKTTKPVTTTKAKTTTTRPVTTTRPTTTTTKPTTTTTKPAPSTPTKAQIDEIVRAATAYGKSLGMGVNNSLTIGNSGWSGPANTQYQSLSGAKDTVYYQIKKWADKLKSYPDWYDGAPVFKVVSKKLSDGNYEIYVLRG